MRDKGLSWDWERIGHEEQEGERKVIRRRRMGLSVVET